MSEEAFSVAATRLNLSWSQTCGGIWLEPHFSFDVAGLPTPKWEDRQMLNRSANTEWLLEKPYVCRFSTNTGWGKSRVTVVSTQNTVYSCIIINCCIIFHMNCKPTFAPPCMWKLFSKQCCCIQNAKHDLLFSRRNAFRKSPLIFWTTGI